MPTELAQLVDAAMLLALPDVLGEPEPDPEKAKDKSVRFRLLERIVTEWVSARAGEPVAP
jgi:hypothetical protein